MTHTDNDPGALADAVLAALRDVPAAAVTVTGSGTLATELRRRLGGPEEAPERPLAVVETTGSEAELAAACAAVRDGGLVLLAGEAPEPIDLDLYRDVHRRGLVVLGIPDPAAGAAPA